MFRGGGKKIVRGVGLGCVGSGFGNCVRNCVLDVEGERIGEG